MLSDRLRLDEVKLTERAMSALDAVEWARPVVRQRRETGGIAPENESRMFECGSRTSCISLASSRSTSTQGAPIAGRSALNATGRRPDVPGNWRNLAIRRVGRSGWTLPTPKKPWRL